jgi:peptidoglycan/LPS O-acetylase OafA/YrhL
LGAAFCIVYFEENYAIEPVNRTPLFTSYCWFMCLAVLGGMAKYGDFENRFTKWMGRQSFGLYVFHYLGISIFALYVAKKRIMPAPAAYLLTLICGFLAGYLLYAVISRIPFFRWAVLGIGKEKKNVQG